MRRRGLLSALYDAFLLARDNLMQPPDLPQDGIDLILLSRDDAIQLLDRPVLIEHFSFEDLESLIKLFRQFFQHDFLIVLFDRASFARKPFPIIL